jgi:soluble lytic murein transglycosylase-like protein
MLSVNSVAIENQRDTLKQYIEKNCRENCVDDYQLLNSTVREANRYDLDFRLLLAIVKVESSFNRKAFNKKSAGLMQVYLKYHRNKFKKGRFDVDDNVRVGSSILFDCLQKHDNILKKALRCYNGSNSNKYYNKVVVAFKEVQSLSFI